MLGTTLENKAGLPDWRTDKRLHEPAAAVEAANAAEADAIARRDRASARILSLDAELKGAKNMKAAEKIEDEREKAADEETKAARDIDRARRMKERAAASYAPLETEAMKQCAATLRAIYAEKVGAVAGTLEALKAQAADLDAFAAHVRATIPEHEFPADAVGNLTGLLRGDVALDFNETLAIPKRLERTIIGRAGQNVDVFLAWVRSLGLVR